MPGTDSFSPSVWLKTPMIEPAASHSGQYGGGGGSSFGASHWARQP